MSVDRSYAQEFIAPLLAHLSERPQFITVKIIEGIAEELRRHEGPSPGNLEGLKGRRTSRVSSGRGGSRKANRETPGPTSGRGGVAEKGFRQLRGATDNPINPSREVPAVIAVAEASHGYEAHLPPHVRAHRGN